jgi:hypothetical protein
MASEQQRRGQEGTEGLVRDIPRSNRSAIRTASPAGQPSVPSALSLFDQPGGFRRSDPETSQAAANNPKFKIRWGSQRWYLLQAYASAEFYRHEMNPPLTDEEAGEQAGVSRVADTRRCSELRRMGLIERVGIGYTSNGSPAMTCRITDEGMDMYWLVTHD